jgi:two-component system nitrogen regulation response regulator GlnG
MMLILVVDDDARSARTLANMLREDGFDVDVAIDGASAIARLTRKPMPSVLVTDLRLSNADGAAVSEFARSRKADIPIIVVTGYPQLASKELSPKPIVLTKPLDYADLSAALARVGVRSV